MYGKISRSRVRSPTPDRENLLEKSGIRYPPGVLVTCCVPWNDREQVEEDLFRRTIRKTIADGFQHLYIFGTAGEGHAVDAARFRDVSTIFREETQADGLLPQVGVIAQSTVNYVERIGVAHDLGFRAFQIALPGWGRLNDTELLRFFSDVCGSFPDSRFLHYNLVRAGRILNGTDYRRIADAVPNLAGTKITGGDLPLAIDVLTQAPELQHFFVQLFPMASMYGECSFLSAEAAMCPSRVHELYRLAWSGQFEPLFRLHEEMIRVDRAIMSPVRDSV